MQTQKNNLFDSDDLGKLVSLLNAKRSGNGYLAKCPCHDDRKESLSFTVGDTQPLIFKCFAGCAQEQLTETFKDLLNKPIREKSMPATAEKVVKLNAPSRRKQQIVATYPYWREKGKLEFEKIRYENKKFAFRYQVNGEWVYSKPENITPIVYCLPKLNRLRGQVPVVICEGEKDCDNLNKLFGDELVAVTNDTGSSGWTVEHSGLLKDCKIIICEDCDTAGRKRTLKINSSIPAENLLGVLRFTPEEVGEKGDVSDWLAKGHSKEELKERITNGLEQVFTDIDCGVLCSDTGNANRLIKLFGDRLRYSYELKTWLCWNGKYWEPSEAIPMELAKKVSREILKDAASAKGESFKELAKWSLQSENVSRIQAMLRLAQSIKGVAVKLEDLDKHPYLLNVRNGVIDLKTGLLQPHNPAHLITKFIDIPYEASLNWAEAAPNWLNFLLTIFESDPEMLRYLQRMAGYSLTGDITERKIFFLWGDGRNGKSTFVNAIAQILGGDFSRRIPISSLLKKRGEAIPNDIAALKGTRLAYSSEAPEGKELDEAFVKDASGGENITARFMRGEWFVFKPEFKLWLSTNHKPQIQGADAAIWDRIHLIPFNYRVPDGQIDVNLSEKLNNEKKAILKWAVLGCLLWFKEGLSAPEKVAAATLCYKKEMNLTRDFLDQCCIKQKDACIKVGDLLDAFKNFSGENTISRHKFNKLIIAEGIAPPELGTGNYTWWKGLGLRE